MQQTKSTTSASSKPKQAEIDAKVPNKTFNVVLAKMRSQLKLKSLSDEDKDDIRSRIKAYEQMV